MRGSRIFNHGSGDGHDNVCVCVCVCVCFIKVFHRGPTELPRGSNWTHMSNYFSRMSIPIS